MVDALVCPKCGGSIGTLYHPEAGGIQCGECGAIFMIELGSQFGVNFHCETCLEVQYVRPETIQVIRQTDLDEEKNLPKEPQWGLLLICPGCESANVQWICDKVIWYPPVGVLGCRFRTDNQVKREDKDAQEPLSEFYTRMVEHHRKMEAAWKEGLLYVRPMPERIRMHITVTTPNGDDPKEKP